MRLIQKALFIFISLSLAVFAQQNDEGWAAILANNPEKALKISDNVKSEDLVSCLKSLEGKYQSQLMLNKFTEAYKTLRKMSEQALGNPLQALFLIRLGFEAERAGMISDYYKLIAELSTAKQDKVDPYTSTVIAIIRNRELLNKNNFEVAHKELLNSARINTISKISGPVYIPAKYGVKLDTALEQDLVTGNYSEYKNIEVNPDGSVKLGNILASDLKNGVAYLYLTISSLREQQAVINLVSNYFCKVWVNGYPINSPDLYNEGYITGRADRIINLHEGKNLVLIKAKRDDTLYISLRDVLSGGKLQEYDILPYEKADWQNLKIKKYSGRIFSKEYVPGIINLLQNDNSVAAVIWKSFYYRYTGNYKAGLLLINSLLAEYSESALILFKAGEFYKYYYNIFESKEQSRIECENFIRKALAIDNDYILPKYLLIELLLASKQENSALELLKEVLQIKPSLPYLYKMLSDIYSEKEWLDLAEVNINKFYKLAPEKVYKVIQFYLNNSEYSKAQEYFRIAKKENSLKLFEQYQILIEFQKFKQAEIKLKQWYKNYPQEKNLFLSEMIALYYKQGKYNKVKDLLLRKFEKNPHAPGIQKALAVNYLRLHDKKEAVKWLKKACDTGIVYGPSMLTLLQRINIDSDDSYELQEYDISLDKIAAEKIKKDHYARASFANVVRVKVQKVFADLSTQEYRHNVVKIFDQQGVSQLAELDVGPGEVLTCRTINPDGREYIPESAENLALDKAISMYGVKIGSMLDYSTRYVTGKKILLEDQFSFADFDNPVIKSRYVLIFPVELVDQIEINQDKGIVEPEVRLIADEVILIWDGKEEKGIEPENYMPAPSKVLPTVKVKIYAIEKERPDIKINYQPVLTNIMIKQTAIKLVEGLQEVEEKVNVIYRWIADNIKANNKIVSARGAFALKSGNIKAKMLLMQAMLEAVGIKSYSALGNISFSVAGVLNQQERVESVADFSWPLLLRIENNNNKSDIWVQINNNMRESSMKNIGKMSLGAMVLENSAYGQRLGVVYGNLLEGMSVLDERINIAEDGSAIVQGGVKFFGESAARTRQVFYNSENLRQYLAQISSQLFPRISGVEYSYPLLADIEKNSGEQNSSLLITCKGKIYNYCSTKGEGLYLKPFKEDKFIGNLIVKLPRKHPLDINMDIKNVVSREFIIPQGYIYNNVPNDRIIKSSFGLFLLDYTVKNKKLKVSASLLLPDQFISAENSLKYNEFLTAVKNAVGRGIEIVKLDYTFGEEVLSEGVVQPEEKGQYMIREKPEQLQKALKEGRK